MELWTMATGLFRRGGGGFWAYMTERTKNRTAVELERERNAATANVIPLLAPGTDFMESEDGGRTRVIRTAPQPPSADSREAVDTADTIPSPLQADEPDVLPSTRLALGQANGGLTPTVAPQGRQEELPVGDLPR
ncbi:hypothetical protein [Streptomyces graminilatus]|uniref:hypothetical protein n=1 Tax=Streptomyces graminilatus TaxID=1464070 RepID=UPI0006E45138|nr:hypothetical protein [Streptomyces graminilatus]